MTTEVTHQQPLSLGRVVLVGIPGIDRLLPGIVTRTHADALGDVVIHGIEDVDWPQMQAIRAVCTQGSPSALVKAVHLVPTETAGRELGDPPHNAAFCIWPPRVQTAMPAHVDPSSNGHAGLSPA